MSEQLIGRVGAGGIAAGSRDGPVVAADGARRPPSASGRGLARTASRLSRGVGAALVGLAAPVVADHPSLSVLGGPAGAVTTVSALPLPWGTWSVGLRLEHVELEGFSDQRLLALAEQEEDVHSVDYLTSLSLGAAYGVTPDLTVGVSVPYVKRHNIREAHHGHDGEPPEVESLGDAEGLGDASLYGLYRWGGAEGSSHHAAVLLGVKTPTGKTDARGDTGERFELELQPGSGSWDPFAGLAFTWLRGRASYDVSTVYRLSTEGKQDTTLGDVVAFDAALAFRLLPRAGHEHDHGAAEPHGHAALDLLLEINGEWRGEDETAGVDNPNSGGRVIFLSPGVRYAFAGGWIASLSVGVPVVTDLNGFQSEPEYRVIGGVSAGF